MSSSVASMLEKSSEVNQQQVLTQEQANQSKNPFESPITECYLENSEFYRIRGGFVAEVIQNPFVKFIDKGMTERVIRDLRKVTLAAFCKTEDQAEIYASDEVMRKNAVFADFLTVIRKDKRIVAYSSCGFIESDLIYAHASMVVPEFQSCSGLGILPNIYLWNKLFKRNLRPLRVVVRTRNKDVASLVRHVWDDLTISGEEDRSEEFKYVFRRTSEVINSPYDEETGIIKNVYPNGLTTGSVKHSNKLNELFLKLDLHDAFFVAGRVNYSKITKIIKREISDYYEKNEITCVNPWNFVPQLAAA